MSVNDIKWPCLNHRSVHQWFYDMEPQQRWCAWRQRNAIIHHPWHKIHDIKYRPWCMNLTQTSRTTRVRHMHCNILFWRVKCHTYYRWLSWCVLTSLIFLKPAFESRRWWECESLAGGFGHAGSGFHSWTVLIPNSNYLGCCHIFLAIMVDSLSQFGHIKVDQ